MTNEFFHKAGISFSNTSLIFQRLRRVTIPSRDKSIRAILVKNNHVQRYRRTISKIGNFLIQIFLI